MVTSFRLAGQRLTCEPRLPPKASEISKIVLPGMCESQLLDQAEKALDLAQQRYHLGLGSIVELSQADLSKTAAEIESARAKYDYQTQTAVLNYQTGKLR